MVAGKLRRWEKYLKNFRLPAWEEIPDFGLYMNQLIDLLRRYLDSLARAVETLEKEGFAPLRRRLEEVCILLSRPVKVTGGQQAEGA